jgi:predicted Co/Zn/Cd cation transporter (cation efflux family)
LGQYLAIDPLALALSGDVYIKLHLPDPPPIDQVIARIHEVVKGMTPDQKRQAAGRVKALRIYAETLEAELSRHA